MDPSGGQRHGNSLARGCPASQMWTFAELPAAWQRQPDERLLRQVAESLGMAPEAIHAYTAVEVPDTSWGVAYYTWATSEVQATYDPSDLLPVLLTSQADFRGLASAEERHHAMQETLDFLLRTGKPPQHLSKIWGLRGDQPAGVRRSGRRAVDNSQ